MVSIQAVFIAAILLRPSRLVGWISTIRVLGDVFELQGFFVWHLIMAIAMCIVWAVLFGLTLLAFWKGKIFLAKDEEVWKDTIGAKGVEEDIEKAAH